MSSPDRIVLPEIDDAQKNSNPFDKSPNNASTRKVQPEDIEAAGSI